MASSCRHPAADYVLASPAACSQQPLLCPVPDAVFVDACGCGCTSPQSGISVLEDGVELPTITESSACNGVSGFLARFAPDIDHFSIGVDNVYVWLADRTARSAWKVDKHTAAVTLVALGDGEAPDVAPEMRISHPDTIAYEGNGFLYSRRQDWLVRVPSAGGTTDWVLPLDLDDEEPFLVLGNDFYRSSSSGALWHADLSVIPTMPEIVEQRGGYDDDDYFPRIGMDGDAVYWLAGTTTGRTHDGAGLALFRSCRPQRAPGP